MQHPQNGDPHTHSHTHQPTANELKVAPGIRVCPPVCICNLPILSQEIMQMCSQPSFITVEIPCSS